MKRTVLKNINYIVTFNDRDETFEHYDILIEGPQIVEPKQRCSAVGTVRPASARLIAGTA